MNLSRTASANYPYETELNFSTWRGCDSRWSAIFARGGFVFLSSTTSLGGTNKKMRQKNQSDLGGRCDWRVLNFYCRHQKAFNGSTSADTVGKRGSRLSSTTPPTWTPRCRLDKWSAGAWGKIFGSSHFPLYILSFLHCVLDRLFFIPVARYCFQESTSRHYKVLTSQNIIPEGNSTTPSSLSHYRNHDHPIAGEKLIHMKQMQLLFGIGLVGISDL